MTVADFYPRFLEHPVICTDSRKITENSIFFALKGETFDGNHYALQCIEQGCSYAVVDHPDLPDHPQMVRVPDVLTFLQDLARYHRNQLTIPVIGLTGTNGKTTTKELIAAVLEKSFRIVSTQGNLNNHIGVPLTVLRANQDTEILIVEMGANHAGEIAFLSEIARPTYGLITNIGRAHLEGFGSYEGVKQTKSELYRFLWSNQGQVLANQNDPVLMELLEGHDFLAYGPGKEPTPEARQYPGFFLEFDLITDNRLAPIACKTKLVGQYNLINCLAALAVGDVFNVPYSKAIEALEAYEPGMNRSEYRETKHNKLILDAYNANPSSTKLALDNFAKIPGNNKMVILGDMFELGAYASESHIEVAEYGEKLGLRLFLIGNEFVTISLNVGIFAWPNLESFIDYLTADPPKDQIILLKGSRGMQLEKLLPYL